MAGLGSVLYELGDYAKAIRVFTPFDPQRNPANEDELAILYGIAICHIARKESKKAVEFLTRVKAKSPKFGNAENLIKQLNEEPGQHQEHSAPPEAPGKQHQHGVHFKAPEQHHE